MIYILTVNGMDFDGAIYTNTVARFTDRESALRAYAESRAAYPEHHFELLQAKA